MTANDFSPLHELANQDESRRRRILRSYEEVKVSGEEVAFRARLDDELDRIAELELAAQAQASNAESVDFPENESFRKLVAESPAFFQYLNLYGYFGIRFAAGRHGMTTPTLNNQTNVPSLGLPSPPLVRREDVAGALDRFQALPRGEAGGLRSAEKFLDGFVPPYPAEYELWLRGLYVPPVGSAEEKNFTTLTEQLLEWALSRARFYASLETPESQPVVSLFESSESSTFLEGYWKSTHPFAARCGVYEIYWLARILRAEISPRGLVTYQSHSWLWRIASRAPAPENAQILQAEEVLREVFGYACDLIQNAVEIAEEKERREKEPRTYAPPQSSDKAASDWRETFDQELAEIASQRQQRRYRDMPGMPKREELEAAIQNDLAFGWRMRICTGQDVENLVGLAFSGGGIRSATFNLGVLQKLRDLDMLRKVDYLSTVSGGGYIGAWLLGNVRRSNHWLSRLTNWEDSIRHLRSFSNYLAPHTGALSVDTWTMWGTWLRNAFLIQITMLVWLSFVLTGTQGLERLFCLVAAGGPVSGALLTLSTIGLTFLVCQNLHRPQKPDADWTPLVAASLAWIGSFVGSALLWTRSLTWDTSVALSYSEILKTIFCSREPVILFGVLFLCLCVIAWCSLSDVDGGWRFIFSILTSAAAFAIMYLALCGVLRIFGEFHAHENIWYAYVFGPACCLFGSSLALAVFIGLVGHAAPDWMREWWTRFGSVLGLMGLTFMGLSLAAVFGPRWIQKLFALHNSIPWVSVAGWLGTVAGGLFAGNSSSSNGGQKENRSSPYTQFLAVAGAWAFLAGGVFGVSAGLQALLAQIFAENPNAGYWTVKDAITQPAVTAAVLGVLFIVGMVFSWRFEINIFGLNQFYRNRIVRCYLGATRWSPGLRKPHPFTGFDEDDEIPLEHLRSDYTGQRYQNGDFRGPFPIVNCTLNLGGSSDLAIQTRQSASFSLTPLRCGFSRRMGGFAPTVYPTGGYAGGVTLGQAVAVSGAAASPNMGYNTSPLVAFLLTMFNVRLGWWFPNPVGQWWNSQRLHGLSVLYLLRELFGKADEGGGFVNVSDGGHFENLGIYELVRRRAKVIIAGDAECDSALAFGSLGNVIRICETDFGAKIDIDTGSLGKAGEEGLSRTHCAIGRIHYSNGSQGYLIYLKASITGDESPEIVQYRASHREFPHETTADQFFSEDQFESYRRLGNHIVDRTFRSTGNISEIHEIATKLFDLWAPEGFNTAAFERHSKSLEEIWERLRQSAFTLGSLHTELMANAAVPVPAAAPTHEETCICLQLLQLMECVFLDLRLDDFWDHPDNRGWAMLFSSWAKSPRLRAVWDESRHTYGIRFEYFCGERLGLATDNPIMRP